MHLMIQNPHKSYHMNKK